MDDARAFSNTRPPHEYLMSAPETPGPDLSQLPPPLLPGTEPLPAQSLPELAPPSFNTDIQSAARKPRHLGLVVAAAAVAVVLVGAVVAVLVFTPFSSSPGVAEQSASPPTASTDTEEIGRAHV